MRFAPGARLGSYEVVGPLGAGGMGEVYLGRDTRLDRDVALKVLPSRLSHDAESIARFRREALALASLNHPNLATVHGFEESLDGSLVLVLERIEGVTLAERLSGSPLPLEDALQICAQVAQALEVAHEHGIVHRDIKPGNVMIGPRGLVKVLDFGLARRAGAGPDPAAWPGGPATEDGDTLAAGSFDGAESTSGSTVGTPGYMSPEQILAGEVDGRTDEFSLGCVLYECLTGRRAFGGTTAEQAMRATLEAEPDLSALPARLPERVRTLLAQCLAKSPAGRPESMRTIRLEIEHALGIRRASALRETGAAFVAHNLPAPTTSFIGREGTLSACGAALGHTRLLTLLGLGGSGKTRLALRLAETRLDAFPEGVWFVDVAPLADAARLDEALAEALEVPDEPGRTLLEGIARALAGRRALVILDNAETHLAACAALAGRLLGACPELKLLVTSREPMGLEAETTFAVPSLAVPAPGRLTAADVGATESALLFAERARAVLPGFTIDDGNAGAVAEICRRLDGIPLALELAAARVRLLGVEQIRSRLDDRFRLLQRGAGAGTDSGRQRTVRAVIQWSWDQLLPPEQALMRRLAVFSGGWTLERATGVIAEHADEFDVLDLLTRLVERSLVVVERDAHGDARYRFLESVWRFAQEMLAADPERDAVRERHLACYLALAKRMQADLSNEKLLAAIAELAQEEENVLAALAWCDHAPDGARRALQLLVAIHRYWSIRGRLVLGRRLLEQALARDAGREPSQERGWALVRLSGFMTTMGDFPAAGRALEESLRVFRAMGETRGMPAVLAGLGVVAMAEGRYEDALKLNEECRAAYEHNGQPRGVGMTVHNIGTIECLLGRNDYGRPRFEAALALLRQVGDAVTEALCLGALAQSLIRLGQLDAATGRLRECLRLLESLEAPRESAYALDAAAELMVARGQMAEAARMLGVVSAARLAIGLPYMPHERDDADAMARRIAEALGPAAAGQATADGRSLTLDQGLAQAARFLGVSGKE
ncbi:MAG TPA: protein kinase [Candidatus Eisenbacteria bacterium]|nr:protein kinase [Candidatus Eisenbacteria bacterium]